MSFARPHPLFTVSWVVVARVMVLTNVEFVSGHC